MENMDRGVTDRKEIELQGIKSKFWNFEI